MSTVPADALGLAALVFLLGLRHGFDPDHLVAIDGLARSSRSRWSGLFFSLGHGAVVTLVALAVAIVASDRQAPAWLETLGACISISLLLVLGVANLLAVFRARPGEPVAPVGLRGRWFAERLGQASHPMVIASVGAAFALSFDTISHALLFSLTGASMAGRAFALGLGLIFTLGMVVTDALNGWWVAKLIAGADARAARASRVMSVAIALLCLALALGALAQYAVPKAALSVASLAVVFAAYLLARRAARPAPGSNHAGRRASIAFRMEG
jgi:high-affinity nickel-transport protein